MTREDIDRIATEYLNATESEFEMQDVIELADKALKLEKAIEEIKTEIEECLKALEEIDRISPMPIYSKNEFMARKVTYEQCLGFINKHIGETE